MGEKILLVFSTVIFNQKGENVQPILTEDGILTTLLTSQAPQCHWLQCEQTPPNPQASHMAGGRAVKQHHWPPYVLLNVTNGCEIKMRSEPNAPANKENYSLALPVQEHLSHFTLFDWNKMHEAKENPYNFCSHHHPQPELKTTHFPSQSPSSTVQRI